MSRTIIVNYQQQQKNMFTLILPRGLFSKLLVGFCVEYNVATFLFYLRNKLYKIKMTIIIKPF